MFEDMYVARCIGTSESTFAVDQTKLNDRLMINHQNGDLTITNIKIEHTGVYKVEIYTSSGIKEKTFTVALNVRAMKGRSVLLRTEVKIQQGDVVEWTSKDKSTLITGMNGDESKTSYTNDERFRDRLKMNAQTGDLTITDLTQTDEGVYKLKLFKADGKITYRIFNVEVTESAGVSDESMTVTIPLLEQAPDTPLRPGRLQRFFFK
nr:uncharacterized protein LOC129454079 [Misgurnus anguillicaudatus]